MKFDIDKDILIDKLDDFFNEQFQHVSSVKYNGVRKITTGVIDLIESMADIRTCGFCTKPCGNDHCVTKNEKMDSRYEMLKMKIMNSEKFDVNSNCSGNLHRVAFFKGFKIVVENNRTNRSFVYIDNVNGPIMELTFQEGMDLIKLREEKVIEDFFNL